MLEADSRLSKQWEWWRSHCQRAEERWLKLSPKSQGQFQEVEAIGEPSRNRGDQETQPGPAVSFLLEIGTGTQ